MPRAASAGYPVVTQREVRAWVQSRADLRRATETRYAAVARRTEVRARETGITQVRIRDGVPHLMVGGLSH